MVSGSGLDAVQGSVRAVFVRVGQVRLVGRDESSLDPDGGHGGCRTEIVAGDVADLAQTPAAFAAIDRMFLAGAAPKTVQQAVTIARRSGAQRIVVLSPCGPEIEFARTRGAGWRSR